MNPIVAAFYDSVLVYAWALNKTLSEGGDPTDGRLITRQIWGRTFYEGDYWRKFTGHVWRHCALNNLQRG